MKAALKATGGAWTPAQHYKHGHGGHRAPTRCRRRHSAPSRGTLPAVQPWSPLRLRVSLLAGGAPGPGDGVRLSRSCPPPPPPREGGKLGGVRDRGVRCVAITFHHPQLETLPRSRPPGDKASIGIDKASIGIDKASIKHPDGGGGGGRHTCRPGPGAHGTARYGGSTAALKLHADKRFSREARLL